jgi:hypothetical protein
VWAATGRRRNRDDISGSPLLHAGKDALDGEKRRREVPVDGGMPSFLADVLDRSRRDVATAGVRDEHIDGPELFLDA